MHHFRIATWNWLAATAIAVTSGPAIVSAAAAADAIDLSGPWRLALDPDDAGKAAGWQDLAVSAPYDHTAQVPGSLDAQRIGPPVSLQTSWIGEWSRSDYRDGQQYASYRPPHEVKLPFWLTPETHYVGPAWYRRTVSIPAEWAQRRVVLHIERCHWAVRAWLDGREIGTGESLSTPNEFDLTGHVAPGEHELVLCIDNRLLLNVGPNSHSVSDHTQGNWNGAIGDIELRSTPRTWVEHCRMDPVVQDRDARATLKIGNLNKGEVRGTVTVTVTPRDGAQSVVTKVDYAVPAGGGEVMLVCDLGPDTKPWDEHAPHLYDVRAIWTPAGYETAETHSITTSFGLRELGVVGTQITLNGIPRFFRGTLDCCVYPLTGYPPMDIDGWRRIIRTCQSHGLNHIRFHSWCPPEAAFAAADELGFYFQVECPSWANQGVQLGAGEPLDGYLYREARRILDAYGNHPSFVLFAYGNEPDGENQNDFLTKWIQHFQGLDDRRLYTGGSGWPMIEANEYHVTPHPRIQAWGEGLKSRINAKPPETQSDYGAYVAQWQAPVISHEIGQWCVYPNFVEIAKYTGHLKAKNFEIFRDFLKEAGMGEQAEQFVKASGKLQTLCYKEDIESALRTPGFCGFQLLGLSDFSGQGTALVGSLDAFWEAKPYVSAAEYRRFAGSVVPLARLAQRTFKAGDAISADVDLANFGPSDLQPATARWKLIDDASSEVLDAGQLTAPAPTGAVTRLGALKAVLPADAVAAKLRLVVAVGNAENDWDLWVYPTKQELEPGEVLVTRDLDAAALQRLAAGGRVLLTAPAEQVRTDQVLGFSPIFWNTAWTERQPPHTLGVLCDPQHPALATFPTESHSNWQWWELINGAAALDLTQADLSLAPVVQVVPDWFDPHRLALAVECRVGPGRLMITSANVTTDQANRPAARQFLSSLLTYMNSDRFDPQAEATIDQVHRLLK